MINNTDRSGWFGASDTHFIMAKNHESKTWLNWWEVKQGLHPNDFKGNIYTEAGNRYEHKILSSISEKINTDRQVKIEEYLLRVNYDGDKDGIIYEVKTHKNDKEFEVSKRYWQQAQVEMYAYQKTFDDFKKLYIVSYALNPEEYYTTAEIEPQKIKFHLVEYDKHWVKGEYLPQLKTLSRRLKRWQRKNLSCSQEKSAMCPELKQDSTNTTSSGEQTE